MYNYLCRLVRRHRSQIVITFSKIWGHQLLSSSSSFSSLSPYVSLQFVGMRVARPYTTRRISVTLAPMWHSISSGASFRTSSATTCSTTCVQPSGWRHTGTPELDLLLVWNCSRYQANSLSIHATCKPVSLSVFALCWSTNSGSRSGAAMFGRRCEQEPAVSSPWFIFFIDFSDRTF